MPMMRRRLLWTVCLPALLVGVPFVLCVSYPRLSREPVYGGKPRSYWKVHLADVQYSLVPPTGWFKRLVWQVNPWKKPAIVGMQTQGKSEASAELLAQMLSDPDPQFRDLVVFTFFPAYGPSPGAWAFFLRAARDRDPEVRMEAYRGLFFVDHHWTAAMNEDYLGLLTDPDPAVRGDARQFVRQDSASLEAISRALRERGPAYPDPALRQQAAAVVADIGPIFLEDIPPLLREMHDPDPTLRVRAMEKVVTIPGWESVAGSALLATAVRDEAFGVRMTAWEKVRGGTLPASADILSLLQEALRHKEPGARVTAARMLARLGVAARPAIPALVDALHDADEGVRKEAAEALRTIDPGERGDGGARGRYTQILRRKGATASKKGHRGLFSAIHGGPFPRRELRCGRANYAAPSARERYPLASRPAKPPTRAPTGTPTTAPAPAA
jgi:HEAT repeat protein